MSVGSNPSRRNGSDDELVRGPAEHDVWARGEHERQAGHSNGSGEIQIFTFVRNVDLIEVLDLNIHNTEPRFSIFQNKNVFGSS